jgi:hypothetical protein
MQYAIFEKNDKRLLSIGDEGLVNDIDGGIPFFPMQIESDGTMRMWVDSEVFVEGINTLNYEEQSSKYGNTFKRLWDSSIKIKYDDNPILIECK